MIDFQNIESEAIKFIKTRPHLKICNVELHEIESKNHIKFEMVCIDTYLIELAKKYGLKKVTKVDATHVMKIVGPKLFKNIYLLNQTKCVLQTKN